MYNGWYFYITGVVCVTFLPVWDVSTEIDELFLVENEYIFCIGTSNNFPFFTLSSVYERIIKDFSVTSMIIK